MERIYKNIPIEIRELETGYQLEILVNDYKESKLLTGSNGKFIEQIPMSTWEDAIKNPSIELWIDHNPYVNVADNISLECRNDGIYAIATLSDKAKGLYDSIKSIGANGISFGFKCLKDNWNNNKRIIEEMNLNEISILMDKIPAYKNTNVECRNITIPLYNDIDIRRKRLELLCDYDL